MKIYINGVYYSVNGPLNILQACDLFSIDIPRFCYHEKLSIAGNCRLCLVEIDKSAKLVASCAMLVSDGMSIFTTTPLVKKSREGILEFLLINHPLDCPICDQGGECDLQDQTLFYGSDRGRFFEYKRAIENKNCGPLIKTVMTRCIQCTRCIRFAHEICGLSSLGSSGRGNNLEISTYISKVFDSELSGNVIDLCPVGALTSKPSAFNSRPWEIKSFDSIDISDSFCSNIKIDMRGFDILRVLPSLYHPSDFWITDKARFSFDGLNKQRLLIPFYYSDTNHNLTIKSSWLDAISHVSELFIQPNRSFFFTTDFESDLESISFLKEICFTIHKQSFCINFFFSDLNLLDFQHFFMMRQLKNPDICLFFFMSPKKELPLLNLIFRKFYLKYKTRFVIVGSCSNFTYPSEHMSINSNFLISFAKGDSFFTNTFLKAKTPLLFFGNSTLENFPQHSLMALLNRFFFTNSKKLNFSFISNSCGELNKYYLGVNSSPTFSIENNDIFLSLNVCTMNKNCFSICRHFAFVVFLGAFGCNLKQFVNLVLPSNSFVEKNASFFNIFSTLKKTSKVIHSPGDSKEDSLILKYILKKLYVKQNSYSNFLNIKQNTLLMFFTIYFEKSFPYFCYDLLYDYKIAKIPKNIMCSELTNNFYLNNALSLLSKNMTKCSKLILNKSSFIL